MGGQDRVRGRHLTAEYDYGGRGEGEGCCLPSPRRPIQPVGGGGGGGGGCA